jgi:excisionase family DNA binding protein
METPTLPTLLTPVDVAEWLSLSARQVERMARRGEIPALALPTGDLVFDKSELLMWLDRLRDQPPEVLHAKS